MGTASQADGPRRSVREAVEELAARHGEARVVDACTALLEGAPPEEHPEIAVGLSVHGTSVEHLRAAGFHDYWWPTWGARGLLYVWSPGAAPAVLRGLRHAHWRPAEMCLKVAARRELADAADEACVLAGHELARVRATAVRALGIVGDTEHVPVVRAGMDDADEQVRRSSGLALERLVVRLDLGPELLP